VWRANEAARMSTATIFNRSLFDAEPTGREPLAAPIRKIVVLGGGTAGWMAALILGRALIPRGVRIEVLESPTVPIIGVGEGSTPWLRGFFESLGIEEREWMPECNATYKCGIRFDGWSTKPGFERYFHPFASMLDNLTMTQFLHNAKARTNGADVHAHPDRFFLSARLAEGALAPKPRHEFPFDVWYGYHFDAGLLGRFLHRKAEERGIVYRTGHVEQVERHANGDLAAVRTREGETLDADFFIDCTGFAGLLIQQTLGTPFIGFADNLFNDAAIALPSPIGERIPSLTVSEALRHGWMWRIPLTNRHGNGYVYSSDFCSADEAETELRTRLGLLDDPTPGRHLRMRVGRVTEHWNRNCLAVGLSQGFIEPLEATALLFIQRTASLFVEFLEAGRFDERARADYNRIVNDQFEGTRDYIVTHYKTNSREDTEYWRANARNTHLSDPLKELYRLWFSGNGIAQPVGEQKLGRGYSILSWYAILCGMGIFPEGDRLRAPDAREARYRLAEVDNLLDRSALNYPDHRAVLEAIPARNPDPTLQLYFW
jgi:glycine/D-amino acid oxidase-like deaminating enzyme